jgi:Pyruvate kinase, barrel domain
MARRSCCFGFGFWVALIILPSQVLGFVLPLRSRPLLASTTIATTSSLLLASNSTGTGIPKKATRWTESSRWEQDTSGTGEQYLMKEKYGTYFKVPNPATLMTKIICTIGPATMNPTMLGKMMDAGMSAARINMSHGNFEYLDECITNVRQAAKSRNRLCPIILDTKGPEIRIKQLTLQKRIPRDASFVDDSLDMAQFETLPLVKLTLDSGDGLVLLTGQHSVHVHSNDDIKSTKQNFLKAPPPRSLISNNSNAINNNGVTKTASVTYQYMATAVNVGDVVLLDDGRISLIVTLVPNEEEVHTRVIVGGELKLNKGVNLPGCKVDLPHLTDKDVQDILVCSNIVRHCVPANAICLFQGYQG